MIFALKDEKIDAVLFVIDVVISAAFEDDSMKEEWDIDIHMINQSRWKEVNVEENVQDDEVQKLDWIEDWDDDCIVSRVDDWNKSQIYVRTESSNEWKWWRRWLAKEWTEQNVKLADETFDACSWNNICSRNHETKWQDCQQAIEVLRIQRDVTLIFDVWISHENEEWSRKKEKDRIVWKWSKREQNALMKMIAKHQAWWWIEMIHECQQSFSRDAEVNNQDHNDEKEFSDDCHDH